jgi:O-acetyl-ADP-ribose deacetylase (regulator of RNase III)
MARITAMGRIQLVEGDITQLAVDAIVNPANSALQLGAGVAGAIRQRGGPSIQRECDAIGSCPVGEAIVTGGGNLKARFVIHAVGPMGSDSDADTKLASACRAALTRASERRLSSIALPAISTGVFGFPMARAAEILVSVAAEFAGQHEEPEKIIFCLWGKEAFEEFRRASASLVSAKSPPPPTA